VLRERLGGLLESAQAVPPPPAAETVPPPTDGPGAWSSADLMASSQAPQVVLELGTDSASDDVPDAEKLLDRAMQSNIASAEVVGELNETRHRLSDHVRHLAALHETSVVISSELNGDRLLTRVLDATLRTVGSSLGSVLIVGEGGDTLVEKLVRGFAVDPLARGGSTDPRLFEKVLAHRSFSLEAPRDADLLLTTNPEDPRPVMALVAPLVHQQEVLGALVAYLLDRPTDTDAQMRLRFLGAVASQAAVALENSRLYARVEGLNRDLECKVAARTAELECAVRDLQVLDKLKDDFLSSMSHELLTPLTSISSFAEILAGVAGDESGVGTAERKEFASIVHREACRLTEMLQALLDLSRLEAGKVTMQPAACDLRDGLLAAYQRQRPCFKARGIKVKVRVDDAMPAARADRRWLGRVFDALLANAAKFPPEGTEVHVTIRRAGDSARVEFRDAGPGVPEALRGAIFERFKQLGDVLTDKTPGLGLGLPTARAVVERNGGSIWHEHAAGGGSNFVFALPLAPRTSELAPPVTPTSVTTSQPAAAGGDVTPSQPVTAAPAEPTPGSAGIPSV
jgi:signal transduction histidine kinase